MLCLLFLIILLNASCGACVNVGSTLFYNRRPRAECWSQDDMAKLKARKMFEHIMLPSVTPDKINTKYIKDTLRYYRGALRTAEHYYDYHTGTLLKEALADAIGGHLRNELLPTVRFAYYAGYVPYRNARELHDFLDSMKTLLNTRGLGWREPRKVPQWSNLTVFKILVGSGRLFDPCACLVMKRDSNSCIHLPIPKLDDNSEPSAVALPFKVGGLVSLSSPHSENILLKYYTTASRCILRSSPEKCRHSDFVNFNNELWHWMKRDVAPHLMDEKLYGAYGGVLRIAAAVQSYGKGLSRRNLFEYQDAGVSKWHPWQALTQSYIYINTDWTPKLYVGLVLLAVLAICLLQICYNYMLGDSKGCYCKGRSKSSWTKDVAYANVDTNFPAMLPDHNTTTRSSDRPRPRLPSARTKSSSVASVKTQRVYDLNENTEKLMEVIVSGNEDTETDTTYTSKVEDSEEVDNVINLAQSKRGKSPPQLQTPVAQLRIETKSQMEKRSPPTYSTSTATHSEVTCCRDQHASESVWSGSSSSSEHSVTTDSSKTRSRKPRNLRDLAWARRVVSKTNTNSRNTTATEFETNSFTTPPSRR